MTRRVPTRPSAPDVVTRGIALCDLDIRLLLREARKPGAGKIQIRFPLGRIPEPPDADSIVNEPKHPAPYFDAYCGRRATLINPRGMTRRWCWWTRDDRQCLPTIDVGFAPGDTLWVKETWCPANADDGPVVLYRADLDRLSPPFTGKDHGAGPSFDYDRFPAGKHAWSAWAPDVERGATRDWRSRTTMPQWVHRLSLLVKAVRVHRLHDIDEADVVAEGLSKLSKDNGRVWKFGLADRDGLPGRDDDGWPWAHWYQDRRLAYSSYWDGIHGEDAWAENPWVAAITVAVSRRRLDDEAAA